MRTTLIGLLHLLEQELRAQDRWTVDPPSIEALRSAQPFCLDRMSLDQWLQWVLLPRLSGMLQTGLELPRDCAIRPMAEQFYMDQDPAAARLIAIIGRIDQLLTAGPSERD